MGLFVSVSPPAHVPHTYVVQSGHKMESAPESDAPPLPTGGPLLTTNSKPKRLESEKRSRWFVSSDEPRDHQTSSLKALWAPLLQADAVDILFPTRVGSMVSGRCDLRHGRACGMALSGDYYLV